MQRTRLSHSMTTSITITCDGPFPLSRAYMQTHSRTMNPHYTRFLPYSVQTDAYDVSPFLTPDVIVWSLRTLHTIGFLNRNSEWMRPTLIITHNDHIMRAHLPHESWKMFQQPDIRESYGITWPCVQVQSRVGSVIWLNKSTLRKRNKHGLHDEHESIDTLAHELAHVITRSVHGHVWRRMCVMMTTLLHARLFPEFDVMNHAYVRTIARTVVQQYRQTNASMSMCHQEADTHARATQRMITRIQHVAPDVLHHDLNTVTTSFPQLLM